MTGGAHGIARGVERDHLVAGAGGDHRGGIRVQNAHRLTPTFRAFRNTLKPQCLGGLSAVMPTEARRISRHLNATRRYRSCHDRCRSHRAR